MLVKKNVFTGGDKMSNEKKVIGEEAIYDAKSLGTSRMLVLGIQHMFAMFGATVLVPLLTGLDVATTLLMAGLGTLLFHLQVLEECTSLEESELSSCRTCELHASALCSYPKHQSFQLVTCIQRTF